MFGFIADEPGARDSAPPFSRLIGEPESLPKEVSHLDKLDDIMDQFRTNSCVANWFSSAIYLAGQVAGRPVKRPSRRWVYDVARYRRTPDILIDKGSIVRLMCEGAAENGIVSEDRFPFSEEGINEPPPFDLDVTGRDALFTGFYNILGADAELERAIDAAVAAGHVPGFAMQVYQNFVDMPSDPDASYEMAAGAFCGDHMLGIIGYTELDYIILNSWGRGWANAGVCRMRKTFVTSGFCVEHTAVTAKEIGAR